MRLPIAKIFAVAALIAGTFDSRAQSIVVANPLEWTALAEGNELINCRFAEHHCGRVHQDP